MQQLAEHVLMAKWKSFKAFQHSGEIQLHSASLFREYHFAEDHILTIKVCKGATVKLLLRTIEWMLEFSNKKHYLKIPSYKLTYEIITVNHTVLVLLDAASGEKTFFAKEASWQGYLNSNEKVLM